MNSQANIEREQATAALKEEKATIEGWCKSSTKITEIIRAKIPANDKTGLGYHPEKDESSRDCSMLKFGMFKPTKKAKLKVPSKPSVSQSSSPGTKITDISQRSTPKLKTDVKPKKSEELKVPPRSYAKGILGSGHAHLKFSNSTAHSHKENFVYRKCYHYGLTDHIASKYPTATKAEKTTKGSKGIWYLDSGCCRHMTGQKCLLTEYKEEKGPSVTFGGNGKGYTRGFGVLSN
ncbi:hypothetical protein L6452_01923 [Arctium lappa]|uniref:Uncharacterized protein n=1 Tax=Arctium lappa TaxID=4217 RepID=A0ACB9FI44_ARCLA|nr:hypothetical protein L6452_01923 [Arctium lappa]